MLILGCQEDIPNPKSIHELVNNWHHAAAVADEDVFFGSMTKDCIYIGTDISERWLRDELKSWSAKIFERESAWRFKAYDRFVEFDESGKIAWWDEKLETWMGPCRGSGVAKNINGEWKIIHYHLSVTVPNDNIQEFIKLVEEPKEL